MSLVSFGLLWVLAALFVSFLLSWLAVVFINTNTETVDSAESFDCGIDPLGHCRVSFDLHFFLIAVVFVILDAEILLSLPIIISPASEAYWPVWSVFLGLLFTGLVVEFFMQTIDWNE